MADANRLPGDPGALVARYDVAALQALDLGTHLVVPDPLHERGEVRAAGEAQAPERLGRLRLAEVDARIGHAPVAVSAPGPFEHDRPVRHRRLAHGAGASAIPGPVARAGRHPVHPSRTRSSVKPSITDFGLPEASVPSLHRTAAMTQRRALALVPRTTDAGKRRTRLDERLRPKTGDRSSTS